MVIAQDVVGLCRGDGDVLTVRPFCVPLFIFASMILMDVSQAAYEVAVVF